MMPTNFNSTIISIIRKSTFFDELHKTFYSTDAFSYRTILLALKIDVFSPIEMFLGQFFYALHKT
jgi:hypothetical protein